MKIVKEAMYAENKEFSACKGHQGLMFLVIS